MTTTATTPSSSLLASSGTSPYGGAAVVPCSFAAQGTTATTSTASPVQPDSDCGSSSGVGGSNVTKQESDAISLDSDSRDSGNDATVSSGGVCGGVPSGSSATFVVPPGAPPHHAFPHTPYGSRWPPGGMARTSPATGAPPPAPAGVRPLYTMTVNSTNGYDAVARPPPPGLLAAGPSTTANGTMAPTASVSGLAASGGAPMANGSPAGPISAAIPNIPPVPSDSGLHDVFVHVQVGETITLMNNKTIREIVGPATIRMTGQSGVSPNALPLRVPMGHLVQQICDEQGRLKHVILSPNQQQPHPPTAAGAVPTTATSATTAPTPQARNVATGMPTASGVPTTSAPAGKAGTFPNAAPSTSNGHGTSPKSGSPPIVPVSHPLMAQEMVMDPGYLAAASMQQQMQRSQWVNGSKMPSGTGGFVPITSAGPPMDPSALYVTPFAGMMPPTGLLPSGQLPYMVPSTAAGPQTDETEDRYELEEDERDRLREALNSIAKPEIVRIFAREAEVTWQELDTSEASASGGPFPQLDASDFVYEIFLYENNLSRAINSQRCEAQAGGNRVRFSRLKPGTDYYVNIRASLAHKDLIGNPSTSLHFRTPTITPETPSAPRAVGPRGPTWLVISWAKGMPANTRSVVLQMSKGRSDPFQTVYEGAEDQTRVTGLLPGTSYKFRLIARNETGDSEPSPPYTCMTASGMPSGHHHVGPSSSHQAPPMAQYRIPAPQITACYNRTIKLVWAQGYDGSAPYSLEFCEGRNGEYQLVPSDCYTSPSSATLNGLTSNREYFFRLVLHHEPGQPVFRSDPVSAKTRKEVYDNSSYQSNQGASGGYYEREPRIPMPTQLQKTFLDETSVGLSWRFPNRNNDFDGYFVVEGAVSAEAPWRVCHKGPATNATIEDASMSLFRVQAVSNRKHTSTSPWTEALVVKRLPVRPKRTPMPEPVTPGACTVPKFSNINWHSVEIRWTLEGPSDAIASSALIYELQRVDTRPQIIASGDQTTHVLDNLKPAELVQVRARAVVVDYEGKRNEGAWSPIGSVSSACKAPSPPVNVRLGAEAGRTPMLVWDAPAEVNGADVRSYVIMSMATPIADEATSGIPERIAETSQTEFQFGELEPATRYSVSVIAVNKGGESEPSNTFHFEIAASKPEAPQQLTVEPVSSTELSLAWLLGHDNGSNLTALKLTVHAAKSLVAEHSLAPDTTEWCVGELRPETLYELRLTAQNAEGASEACVGECRTFASPPDPPELALLQAQSNSLKLKWHSVPSASTSAEPRYFYLEKENDSGTFSPVFEGEARSAKVRGLRESAVHRFRIRSAHAKGVTSLMGPWSQLYEFSTTRPPPPAVRGAPTVTEIGPSVFQIDWPVVRMVNNNNEEEAAAETLLYRLQVAPKADRRGAFEPWKTVYEGTCPTFTLSISPLSGSARMARVFVVQKSATDELCSAPSPIANFAPVRTPNESPRKRLLKAAVTGASGTSTPVSPSEDDTPTRSPSSVHRANKNGFMRRVRRLRTYLRRSFWDGSVVKIIMLAFVVIAVFFAMFLKSWIV